MLRSWSVPRFSVQNPCVWQPPITSASPTSLLVCPMRTGPAAAADAAPQVTDRWDADPTDIQEQASPVEVDDEAYPHQAEAHDSDLLE